MFTVKELIGDPGQVFSALESGLYAPVTDRFEKRDYQVFVLSVWDEDVDTGKKAHTVSMSELNNRAGFHIHHARDTATSLVVMDRRAPKWILEPGEEAVEYLCARKGASQRELRDIFLAGDIGRLVSKKYRLERKKLRQQVKEAAALGAVAEVSVEQMTREIEDLKLYVRALEVERDRLQKESMEWN